eukprot:gnl/TRDRNA2_/TRDRNA2_147454_c1_seq1.p1 gnl/TRDRNA2_/TRDRNA2_147454_c1~~gnl/TRDRNA2_/TRDRNA2_147454_c1_seq1.p1  ORF type:complete len:167 (+),score=24.27 gnl/TRDRNA2_/TRDRNA2_147454_c1_seq1:3-503(+)
MFLATGVCRAIAIELSPTRWTVGKEGLERAAREADSLLPPTKTRARFTESPLGNGAAVTLELGEGGPLLEWRRGDYLTDLGPALASVKGVCSGRIIVYWSNRRFPPAFIARAITAIVKALPPGALLVSLEELKEPSLELESEGSHAMQCSTFCSSMDQVRVYVVKG